ncbi:MAG: SUMF1/EgtB/PvdO family nonheme iron enzyme [Mariprofundaceae bacterium]|nr:SUMF1/EgtB/PvdO family nonheme iron enzyme [Mariprofundaceae bacterium]
MKHSILACLCAALFLITSSFAVAAERYALVITNDAYRVDPLKYALDDGRAVKERLEALGFKVSFYENLAKDKAEVALQTFSQQLTKGSVALFFYSGHAMQVFGTNYLLSPFKRKMKSLERVPQDHLSLTKVVTLLDESQTALNIVLLDASRHAPTTRRLHRGLNGLAKVHASPKTLISFADDIGEIASDRSSATHSRYTEGLLAMLQAIDVPIGKALAQFHKILASSSKGKHAPWLSGAINSSFVLNPKTAFEAPAPELVQAQKAPPKHGDTWVEPFVDMTFTYIEKGEFMMGSPESEENRYRDEDLHRVSIEKGFWMATYEVTFDQYKKFTTTTSFTVPSNYHWGEGKRPVILVTWFHAVSFANWLSAKTGKHYRLPTEAEWEYSARAGTKTAFSFGETAENASVYAWNGSESNAQTHPVGLKKANPWGLYDMHGNVWEWTSSLYHQEYNGSELMDHSLNIDFEERAVRGGSWYFLPKGMRSADRRLYSPKIHTPYIGFRLVLEE